MVKQLLFSCICWLLGWLTASARQPIIHINQVAYQVTAPKSAVLTNPPASVKEVLLMDSWGRCVLNIPVPDPTVSTYSQQSMYLLDFSSVKVAGQYRLLVIGTDTLRSRVITINDNPYQEVAKAVLKAFYFHRSDEALPEKYAGRWNRKGGHSDTVIQIHASAADKSRPEGSVISSPGGWYDAGDYNKYIVNSGISTATLLMAYEHYPKYWNKFATYIPETENTVPDILDEAIYNMRWMLTMQDANDGGVYSKLTNATFDGMVMPGVTTAQRYVVQKSTAAALNFSAVMAIGARIFVNWKKELPGLADSCLNAAEDAWRWAINNPDSIYNQERNNYHFFPAIVTGEYGDKQLNDEWFWAATELWLTSRKQNYMQVMERKSDAVYGVPSWGNVGQLGMFSLIFHQEKNVAFFNKRYLQVEQIAANAVDWLERNPWKIAFGSAETDFNWGSNSGAANLSILLLQLYKNNGDERLLQAARSNVDYILGKNATDYCFVTGFGSNPPLYPHHRISAADGIADPVPGWLVGGPNRQAYKQDKAIYHYKDAERSYADDVDSYASNEVAINWNAPLVYLLHALAAIDAE